MFEKCRHCKFAIWEEDSFIDCKNNVAETADECEEYAEYDPEEEYWNEYAYKENFCE